MEDSFSKERNAQDGWDDLQEKIASCTRCPRLVEYRRQVAITKRRAYRDCTYWGRPVPSLGDASARLLIVGLAPGAHGANRTGRMFTGDRSGDFLYPTLHRFGFCNREFSREEDRGFRLLDACISAAIHCVPPLNKPSRGELDECREYLRRELLLLKRLQVVVALGAVAWKAYLEGRRELGWEVPRPLPLFQHAASYRMPENTLLIASYHPSQQNTQTGRLTQPMFDAVFEKAAEELRRSGSRDALSASRAEAE